MAALVSCLEELQIEKSDNKNEKKTKRKQKWKEKKVKRKWKKEKMCIQNEKGRNVSFFQCNSWKRISVSLSLFLLSHFSFFLIMLLSIFLSFILYRVFSVSFHVHIFFYFYNPLYPFLKSSIFLSLTQQFLYFYKFFLSHSFSF